MSRKRSVHCSLCCFEVADFSHQDHIGVVTQNGTQSGCKRKVVTGIDLALDNSLKFVFDRIFQRDDVALLAYKRAQECVERCGFTGSRRTRHQNESIGKLH